MIWKGVIIEESLEDKRLLDSVDIIGDAESLQEDDIHHKMVEIKDENKDSFIDSAKNLIRNGWYLHICKDDKIIVVFKNKIFELNEKEEDKIKEAQKYGLSLGIKPEQMPFKSLIRNPFD